MKRFPYDVTDVVWFVVAICFTTTLMFASVTACLWLAERW